MSETEIYDIFCADLTFFANEQDPVLPVSFQGVNFVPPDEGCWLEVRFFPNETENYGIANNGGEVHLGIIQVGVCYRSGAGILAPMTIATLVIGQFKKGTLIGPARVTRPPWLSSAIEFGDHNAIPVSIPYRVFTVTEESGGGGGPGPGDDF